ncbi:hypothetical protein [Streptomyces sp. NPDC003480]
MPITTFNEDASKVRTSSAPHAMATMHNLAVGLLRLSGTGSITAARRHHARNPHRPLTTLGIR